MRVRLTYTLFINDQLMVATFGNTKFNNRIKNATFGRLYDCSFNQLKFNLKILNRSGYKIIKRNH